MSTRWSACRTGILGFIHSFIHSINQWILIECLLCARLHARPRGPTVKGKSLSLHPQSSHSSEEEITKYQQRQCLLAMLSTGKEIPAWGEGNWGEGPLRKGRQEGWTRGTSAAYLSLPRLWDWEGISSSHLRKALKYLWGALNLQWAPLSSSDSQLPFSSDSPDDCSAFKAAPSRG